MVLDEATNEMVTLKVYTLRTQLRATRKLPSPPYKAADARGYDWSGYKRKAGIIDGMGSVEKKVCR